MQNTILKKYKDVICKNCTKENCKKGIVIYNQTIHTETRTKQETCAKCVDYKSKTSRRNRKLKENMVIE